MIKYTIQFEDKGTHKRYMMTNHGLNSWKWFAHYEEVNGVVYDAEPNEFFTTKKAMYNRLRRNLSDPIYYELYKYDMICAIRLECNDNGIFIDNYENDFSIDLLCNLYNKMK